MPSDKKDDPRAVCVTAVSITGMGVHRMPLHVAIVQAERKFVHITGKMFRTGVVLIRKRPQRAPLGSVLAGH